MSKKIFILLISFIYLNADFIRNNDIQVVTDTKTGFIWNDNDSSLRTWKDSITYCEDLKIGFYEDWRMPNYNELYSLVDLDKIETKIDDVFENKISDLYWTSTLQSFSLNNTWTISFSSGHDRRISVDNSFYVRCIHN